MQKSQLKNTSQTQQKIIAATYTHELITIHDYIS